MLSGATSESVAETNNARKSERHLPRLAQDHLLTRLHPPGPPRGPEFILRREVVTALRKIDNPRAVDLLHEQLEGLPGIEGDRLAHTLAGTDILSAASSLARSVRISGDVNTLARAVFAARAAQNEHRTRLEALRNGEGTADVGGADGGQAEVAGADPRRAISKAGLDVIRRFESILRGLGRGR